MTTDSATHTGATDESQLTEDQLAVQAAAEAKAKEEADAAAEVTRKQEEEAMRARQRDPRNAMVEEIAARHRESVATDFTGEGGEGKTADELADDAADTERKRLEEEAAREAQLATQAGKPTVLKSSDLSRFQVEQVIDGQTKVVSLEDAMREVQKHGAADYRLSKAQETLDSALAIAKDLEARASGDGKKPAPKADDTGEVDVDAKAKEAFDLVLDGKVDEAAKLFAETISSVRGRSATPDADAIVSAAVGRIKLEQQLTSFQKDYSDVANDRYLGPMVDREFLDLVPKDAKGQPTALPPDEFGKKLREAGDKVRTWAKEKFGEQPKPDDAAAKAAKTLEERRAAKENLDQTTGAGARASTQQAASTAEPTPQERSSVIASIAKGRGQQL